MDVGEAVVLGEREQDAGRAAAVSLPAEAAVANTAAGRTLPLLGGIRNGKMTLIRTVKVCQKTLRFISSRAAMWKMQSS